MQRSRWYDGPGVALDIAAVAADCTTIEELRSRLLAVLARAVDAELAVYHQSDFARLDGPYEELGVVWPSPYDLLTGVVGYAEIAAQAPLVRHFAGPAPVPVVSLLNDLIPHLEWHQTPLYRQCFRHVPVEDHLGVMVSLHGGRAHGITLIRSAGCFDREDRRLLELLIPHLRSALRRCLVDPTPYLAISLADPPRVIELAGNAIPPPSDLTPRQHEVLTLVAGGLSNRLVARRLQVAPRTVDKHLENAFAVLGVQNRVEAVRRHRDIRARL